MVAEEGRGGLVEHGAGTGTISTRSRTQRRVGDGDPGGVFCSWVLSRWWRATVATRHVTTVSLQ